MTDHLPDNLAERLCRNASIGIVITDAEFNVRMLNSAAAALFDVNAAEKIGQPIEELVPEHRRGLARRLMMRVRTQNKSGEVRLLYPMASGKRHLAIQVDPILGDSGELEGVCLWVRDQTRRMELERRLARIDKLASLGQLAGGLAHHLNNVLGGIVTAVDHGLEKRDSVAMRRALQRVSEGLGNAVKLTRRLMEFSTPELPEQNLVDLTEAVIGFVEQVQERLRSAGRDIDLEIRPTHVMAVDQAKMNQVLDSLLTNAEQAMSDGGGHIQLLVASDDVSIRVEFRDDGPGVSMGVAEKMFEPFFTTRGALGGGSEGNLGLGLTLGRRLMSEMGGSLDYLPRPGCRGACFVLSFPLRRSDVGEK
jgi:PAS domain S-box-containing protein